MKYTIKEVTRQTGIPADSLRYYDKLGIVSPQRAENGYRYYSESDLHALRYVMVMKYAHFSLAEIKSIIGMFDREVSEECNRQCRGIFESRLMSLQKVVDNYQHIMKLMTSLLPLIGSVDRYYENEGKVDAFVEEIFENIRQDVTPVLKREAAL